MGVSGWLFKKKYMKTLKILIFVTTFLKSITLVLSCCEWYQSYIILLTLPHSDVFPKASFKQLRMRVSRIIDTVF